MTCWLFWLWKGAAGPVAVDFVSIQCHLYDYFRAQVAFLAPRNLTEPCSQARSFLLQFEQTWAQASKVPAPPSPPLFPHCVYVCIFWSRCMCPVFPSPFTIAQPQEHLFPPPLSKCSSQQNGHHSPLLDRADGRAAILGRAALLSSAAMWKPQTSNCNYLAAHERPLTHTRLTYYIRSRATNYEWTTSANLQ